MYTSDGNVTTNLSNDYVSARPSVKAKVTVIVVQLGSVTPLYFLPRNAMHPWY